MTDCVPTDRRSGSVGELVGKLIDDFAFLLVDLERELAVPGTERGRRFRYWPNHLLEFREVGLEGAPSCAEPVAEIMSVTSVTDSERHRYNVFIPTSPYYLFCAVHR